MYAEFNNIESLLEAVKQDKDANGVDSSTRLRYPIRFVLFDNFRDSYAFTIRMIQDMGLTVESVQSWLDPEYPDIMLSGPKLCSVIQNYIRSLNGDSKIITPFSELARFYDNIETKVFDCYTYIKGLDYICRAKEILKLFLTDFTEEEIDKCVNGIGRLAVFSR